MKETQITNTSWKTFTLSFSRFQRRKKLVSRDLNVASYCPSNTIQKVLNLSEFMRPHSILQCLVSVVEYVHICKQAWGEIHLTNSKTSILLLLSPFHVFFFFFFHRAMSTTNDKSVNCNTSCTFSTQSFALLLQMHTTQKTPDSPPYKSGGHFYKRLELFIPTQWGITAYKHQKKKRKWVTRQ